jgi:uncharacterized protein YggE
LIWCDTPQEKKMSKFSWMISGWILLAMAVTPAASQERTTDDSILVTGQGFVDAEPDMAKLRVNITATAPSIDDAKSQVDNRYRAAVEALTAVGVPDEDIEGTGLRAQKEYEWSDNKRLYKGERVIRFLNITLRDINLYGEVLDALVEAGISAVDQTTMGFSDENALRQGALGVAADNAKANADFLARRLGRKLGKVVRITDQSGAGPGPFPPQPRMMMAEASSQDQGPPREMFGTRRVNATITVEFELN